MCFFGLAFLLEIFEHLVHSQKSPSSSCCLLKWRPRLPLDVKHLLLILQTTSSHFSWHTGPGAYGGCFSCWMICHNGHNMQTGAMGARDMSPLILFAVKYLISLCAGGSRPMLVCHVVCKSHLGLVALITLSEEEGFALPGHLHLSTKHLAWALKLQNNFSSS